MFEWRSPLQPGTRRNGSHFEMLQVSHPAATRSPGSRQAGCRHRSPLAAARGPPGYRRVGQNEHGAMTRQQSNKTLSFGALARIVPYSTSARVRDGISCRHSFPRHDACRGSRWRLPAHAPDHAPAAGKRRWHSCEPRQSASRWRHRWRRQEVDHYRGDADQQGAESLIWATFILRSHSGTA
jgi:hypothetical protein